jgi:L-threonylcarbamoyladenylate synthase
METEVFKVDPSSPAAAVIGRAAAVLRAGGLVAFPTETVYGLGANALDSSAVARIFTVKGRPANNPLIVHVADAAEAGAVAAEWSPTASRLAACFWPGPLTLVLPRRARVPDVVAAGGPTVAVRVPAHPVALALLRAAEMPVAAPSANRSTELSPTLAGHVLAGLDRRIDLVLDAGPTAGGLESTVLDVTTSPPRILRPGLVTPGQIEAVIGRITRPSNTPGTPGTSLPSPGMMARHYAPRAIVEVVSGNGLQRVEELCRKGVRVGWLTFDASGTGQPERTVVMPAEAEGYAARLYAVLHALDEAGVERIVVAAPPDAEAWLAVRDRLRRASAGGSP